MLSRIIGAVAWLACTGLSLSVMAQDKPLPETPSEYEAFAIEENAKLQALYERWRAAKLEARAAKSRWPQPNITYQGRFDLPGVEDRGGRHMGGVAQKIPWPGVLEKAAQPAQNRAKAIRYQFEAKALEIVFDVREQMIEIARNDAIRRILREKVSIYANIIETVESQLGSNEADYGDLLRVKTAKEKIEDRLTGLESDRRQLVSELKTKLDLPQSSKLTFDFSKNRNPLESVSDSADRQELIEAARRSHPELASDDAMASAETAKAEYAWARRLPWPTASLGVQSRPMTMRGGEIDRQNALMLQLSVPLPLFLEQYRDQKNQFERQVEAISVEQKRTALDFASRIERAVTRIEENRQRLDRYKDHLLPLAKDSTDQMLQQIESGDRNMTDYLLSFEQQLDLETNVIDFRAAIATEYARLEMLSGGVFEAYPNRDVPEINIDNFED